MSIVPGACLPRRAKWCRCPSSTWSKHRLRLSIAVATDDSASPGGAGPPRFRDEILAAPHLQSSCPVRFAARCESAADRVLPTRSALPRPTTLPAAVSPEMSRSPRARLRRIPGEPKNPRTAWENCARQPGCPQADFGHVDAAHRSESPPATQRRRGPLNQSRSTQEHAQPQEED